MLSFIQEQAGKNLHMEHIEDEIINHGVPGGRAAINFLRSLRDMLAGASRSSVNMTVKWDATGSNSYQATDRQSGKKVRRASRADLVFGSNSQLRALAEVYSQTDNHDKFINDFISAWNKVMNADRFDLEK